MSNYDTLNPVPSHDPRDLDDNAVILDQLLNRQVPTINSRLGVPLKTYWQILQESSNFVKVSSPTDTTPGRILTVGYGGLGADAPSYSAAAITATMPRLRFLVGNTVTGMPYAGFWGIEVQGAFDNYCKIEAYDLNDNNARYFATANNGTFSAWMKYYHTGNTTRASDGTLKAI